MNKKALAELAIKCGFGAPDDCGLPGNSADDMLVYCGEYPCAEALIKFADAIAKAEREACAKLCEAHGREPQVICHTEYDDTMRTIYARECAAAIRAMSEREQWQPIATAPRDGTWVLLFGGTTDFDEDAFGPPPCVVGKWLSEADGYILDADENGWQFAWYDSGVYGVYYNPTHWRPLL